ncbi:ATP-binding cassette domain-containing protein [Paenibacillus sp. SC116]|uniref:ATP-binding cassette domain-containing protein n=1 Tax=Paenibacillus sp. SC116 TaxID=2968986 RepID=UPI00215A8FB6|nr:ATP-binding cassette domain-containing protein [Paenibacillus sp. SC116]MCR8844666.1 ATP-binding cassette domain-containing protein [Paenibacillus sp. SC116]
MAIVSSEKLGYQYVVNGGSDQSFALKDISFEWEQGKFYAILGAAGSGKSTLLQHLNGIFQPTAGQLRVLDVIFEAGVKRNGLKQLRKRVGLVFQFPEQQLFADTVEQDLMFGPLKFGMSEQKARQAAREALRTVGLPEAVLTMNPFQLSGGQMRKAAIAAVLASNPDLLVLDEPTATLDPLSRQELIQLLHRLTVEQGKTVAVVTHRLDEMLPFASDYMLMKAGRLVFQGSRAELLAQPLQLQDAGLVLPATLRLGQLVGERCRGQSRVLETQGQELPITVKEWADRLIQMHQQNQDGGRASVVHEDSSAKLHQQQQSAQSAERGANVYYAITGESESAKRSLCLLSEEDE